MIAEPRSALILIDTGMVAHDAFGAVSIHGPTDPIKLRQRFWVLS
jgi:hypothetical protein